MFCRSIRHRSLMMLVAGACITLARPGAVIAQELTPSGCKRATTTNLTSVLDAVLQEMCPCGCNMPLATCDCTDAKKIKAARLPGGVPPIIIPNPPGGPQPGTPGGGPLPNPPPIIPPGGPGPRDFDPQTYRRLYEYFQSEEMKTESEINVLYEVRRRCIHEARQDLERLEAEEAREAIPHEQRLNELASRLKNARYDYEESVRKLAEIDAMTLFDRKSQWGSVDNAENFEMSLISKKADAWEEAEKLNLEMGRENGILAALRMGYFLQKKWIRDERDLTEQYLSDEARRLQNYLDKIRAQMDSLVRQKLVPPPVE